MYIWTFHTLSSFREYFIFLTNDIIRSCCSVQWRILEIFLIRKHCVWKPTKSLEWASNSGHIQDLLLFKVALLPRFSVLHNFGNKAVSVDALMRRLREFYDNVPKIAFLCANIASLFSCSFLITVEHFVDKKMWWWFLYTLRPRYSGLPI